MLFNHKTFTSLVVAAFAAVLFVAPGAQTDASADPINYKIDTSHSAIIFKVKHKGVAYSYGRFNEFGGTVVADTDSLTDAQIEVTVKADSIDTANEGRDKHLISGDFFNTRQFPELTFKSTSIEEAEDGYKMKGEITLLGKTQEVEADLDFVGADTANDGTNLIGAEATFTIKRSEFGMNYMVGPLGDDVKITVSIEANDKK